MAAKVLMRVVIENKSCTTRYYFHLLSSCRQEGMCTKQYQVYNKFIEVDRHGAKEM